MIKLYIHNISELYDGVWRNYLPLLPPVRQHWAQNLRRDHDSARCVGAWLLLRDALSREGVSPDAVTIQKNTFGKPFLKDGPEFSISHAGPYAMLAISDQSVGADIESARCTMDIAKHCFAPPEVTAAQKLSGEEQRLFLQRLWVAKEAFVKAIGTGLSTPFHSFCVTLTDESADLTQDVTTLPLCITEFVVGEFRAAVVGVGHEIDLYTNF